MFARLMPREGRFFEMFNRHAEQMVLCARELHALVVDPSSVEIRARNIKSFESAADRITHDVMHLLHQTFITPIDREDIRKLVSNMDDVLDLMEDVAQCISLYDIRQVPEAARQLAALGVTCTEKVQAAVARLSDLKRPDALRALCRDIDQLESEADQVMRGAIVRLFREEPDIRELIKLKAIFELLETVTDRCNDVANMIEGIVLEYS